MTRAQDEGAGPAGVAGPAILLVEQNLGLALKLADDVYVLDRGQIVYHGAPAALDADADVKQRYLGSGPHWPTC